MERIELEILERSPVEIELDVLGGGGGEWYEGPYEVVPTRQDQVLETALKTMEEDVLVHEIPYWETANQYGTTFVIGE